MGGLFSSPKVPSQPYEPPAVISVPELTPEPAPPAQDNAAIAAAQEKQRKAAADAKGRGSTFLTSGLGLSDEAPTQKKTLLGQ